MTGMNRSADIVAPSGRCARCGAPFTCGMEAGLPECWCAQMPRLLRVPEAPAGCYCAACLAQVIESARAPMADAATERPE